MPDSTTWTIIFAGAADIDDANLRAQLENWLPKDLDLNPPAVQQTVPRSAKGLRKVVAWLEDEFGDDIDRPEDLTAYIRDLDATSDTYLVVLWGEGGDPKTEALVDQAARHGITVLDLTDGLDELKLDDNQPQPPAEPGPETEAAPARRRRRSRTAAEAPVKDEEAAVEDKTPPWREDKPRTVLMPTDRSILSALLAIAFQGAAAALQQHVLDLNQPGENLAAPEPAAAETARTWLQNPANPKEYKLKGRGRPRNDMKNWTEVQLTAAQETGLGL